jgi:O-antigen/teichoic acid export membrane protein
MIAAGTVGAQALTMIFMPFITRLYSPEELGLLGVFVALTLILIPISALTYPNAIVLPQLQSEARSLALLSLYITIAVSLLTAIVLWIYGSVLFEVLNLTNISNYAMLIPLALFFSGILQIAEQWAIRQKLFKFIAKAALLHSMIINTSKLGLGLTIPVAAVLITIFTLGIVLHALLIWLQILKQNGYQFTKNTDYFSFAAMKAMALKYLDFPRYRVPQILITTASMSLPILMLSSYFGAASAGFYSVAISVLAVPSLLIGKSVGDVLYQRITEDINAGKNVTNLLIKTTGTLALLGLIPFTIIMIFGPLLFSFVFGIQWIVAGEYAQWLALWLFVSLIARPVITAIPVMNLQSYYLLHEVISIIIVFFALFIGFKIFESDYIAIALFTIMNVVLYIILIFFMLYKSSQVSTKLELPAI